MNIAFWRDDKTANPDNEVYTALLPSLLTTKGMIIGISSAYRRNGLLYSKFRDFYGTDSDDVLFIKGDTQTFNQIVDMEDLAALQAADPTAAKSEWNSEFRYDLSGFLDNKVVDASVNHGRPLELPSTNNVTYRAFTDSSGGATSGDAYSICILHRTADGLFVVDAIRAKHGLFDPYQVTRDYAVLCKQYKVTSVTGDAYAKEWVAAAWLACGITYVKSELTASELYGEAEALFMRGLVELPDEPITIRELKLLERRPSPAGKDAISHPRGTHDDRANALCGALVTADKKRVLFGPGPESDWVSGPSEMSEAAKKKAQAEQDYKWRRSNYFRSLGIHGI